MPVDLNKLRQAAAGHDWKPTPPTRGVPAAPPPVVATPGLSRGWSIALGCISGVLFARFGGAVATLLLLAVPPQPPSWLGLISPLWVFTMAILVGVMVTGILMGKKKRAGIAAGLAAGATLVFATLVGVPATPTTSPSSTTGLAGKITGSLSPATQVPAWLRAAVGQRSITPENYPPPPDFQIRDRCAGEGCGYQRPWLALKQVPLFATWGKPNAERVYTIAERETVTALSGVWITRKPAVREVQESISIGGVELQPGDLIYILMNLGEGFVRGFFHGKLADFSLDAPNNRPVTRTLRDNYDFVLWVQMKTSTGTVGWTNDAAYPSFDGQYKLFTYLIPKAISEDNGLWDYELEVQAEKAASIRIGSVILPATPTGFTKVHTGFLLRPNELQAIELIANDDGQLLAKTFVRPAASSGEPITPTGDMPPTGNTIRTPDGDDIPTRVQQLTQKAQDLFLQREYQAALRTCNEGLALDPKNEALLQLRARIEQTMQVLGIKPEQARSMRQEPAVSPTLVRVFTHPQGSFTELGDGRWEEHAADGKYHFTQQHVDGAWIYLRDNPRNINVRLPLTGGWCAFQRGPLRPTGPWNNLYNVTAAR